MTHSENIGDLVAALVKARKAFKAFTKANTATVTTTKGQYSYKYGDLSALFDASFPALLDNGLFLSQAPHIENEAFHLVTHLFHTSGQWIRTAYPLSHFERPQEQGSAITYAKRYAASALLGVAAEEDDDGAMAEQSVAQKEVASPTKVKTVKVDPTRNPAVVRYTVVLMDGRKATTIKDDLGNLAKKHEGIPVEDRPLVHAVIERGQYGMDLAELTLVAPPADQPF